MLSKNLMSTPVISYDDMFMMFTQQFLQSFEELADCDFQEGTHFNFKIKGRSNKKRINPIIRMATLEDIDEIIYIYKDVYENTYPYKEMEDEQEIQKMLDSSNVEWLIFETVDHEIVGCFTFILDFEKKLGNIRGFNIKKKFLGKLDIMKMAMGSIIAMYKKYYDKIFRWYGECRTAHSKSQYFLSALGFKPVAFYPCKDVFYNKVESDLLILSYDERTLTTMRSKNTPKFLPEVLNGFLYSTNRYELGAYEIENFDNITIKDRKIRKLEKVIEKHISRDRFGYESIKFTFKNSDSYFEFLYTPTVQNFEKTNYKVSCLEELYVFVQEFLKYGKDYNIRYCEAFISAYKPSHQKLILDFGLQPRGYVPSWKYNHKSRTFEDCILFNWFDGGVNEDIQLLQEGQNLVEILGISYNYEPKTIFREDPIINHVSFKEKVLSVLNSTEIMKPSIFTGLIIYLLLLFAGLGVANLYGFNISTHFISQLGSIDSTHFPFLFNSSSVLGGLTTIWFYIYLFEVVRIPLLQEKKSISQLPQYAMITGIFGSIGIIFVGVFSIDRAFGILHILFSLLAFGGFTCSLFLFGVIILRFDTKVPKKVGILGIPPLFVFVLQCALPNPLLEWILLFFILSSLIPLFIWLVFRKPN